MHRWEIDGRFDITTNAGVLEFLRRTMPSAHSDVAEELRRSASGLDRVFNYCPDPRRYAFVLHHLADFSIIGVAYGNRGSLTGCRTSGGGRRSKTGGSAATELGPHGIYFAPRSNEEPLRQSRRRLALWCSVAACFTPRTDAPARALGAHPYCTVAARGSVGDYSRAAATCRVGPGGRADVSAMPPNGWRCSWIPLPIPDRHPIARY